MNVLLVSINEIMFLFKKKTLNITHVNKKIQIFRSHISWKDFLYKYFQSEIK